MSQQIIRVVRIVIGLFIIYMVYQETGPWTVTFCLLTLIGFEAQALLSEIQAKFNDTIVSALRAVRELVTSKKL